MVAHVLVDQATLDVDGLVLGEQLLHSGELLECLMELLCTAEHQAQVEHGRDESAAVLERIFEEHDRTLNLFLLQVEVRVRLASL